MRIKALFGSAILASVLVIENCVAFTTTLFVTGDSAAGIPGALFEEFQPGAINHNDQIVFPAELQVGPGGVASGDNQGIWHFDAAISSLVARTGSGDVPEVAGADFEVFRDLGITHSGEVYLRAAMTVGPGGVTGSNEEGIWRFISGSDELVVRQGVTPAPTVPTNTFDYLPNTLSLSGAGQIPIIARMGLGGAVNSNNDNGIWSYDTIGGSLLARENVTTAPGLTNLFESFSDAPVVNDNQQLAFRGAISSFSGDPTIIGIWRYTATTGELIVREGVGNVPGVAATSFVGLSNPALNGAGQIGLSSSLTHEGGVNSSNDAGLWLYTNTTGTLLARSGSGGVPGIAGASFESFEKPLLSDSGSLLVEAELQAGVGGVTASDNQGLWTFDGQSSSLGYWLTSVLLT